MFRSSELFLYLFFSQNPYESDILESSGIFAINNVAIVTLSTFAGILLFEEKLDREELDRDISSPTEHHTHLSLALE